MASVTPTEVERRRKIGLASEGNKYRLGTKLSDAHKAAISKANKERGFSELHRQRISAAKLGEKRPNFVSPWRGTNMPHLLGPKNHNWKGGITPKNQKIRKSVEYRLWREAVFARDNWTCQNCGERGCVLNADHVKSFALYPELRFAIDNGRTLCVPCHRKTDTWGRRSMYRKNI